MRRVSAWVLFFLSFLMLVSCTEESNQVPCQVDRITYFLGEEREVQFQFIYNEDERLTEIQRILDGSTVQYMITYKNGKIVGMSGNDRTWEFTYSKGKVSSIRRDNDDYGLMTFKYNGDGQIAEVFTKRNNEYKNVITYLNGNVQQVDYYSYKQGVEYNKTSDEYSNFDDKVNVYTPLINSFGNQPAIIYTFYYLITGGNTFVSEEFSLSKNNPGKQRKACDWVEGAGCVYPYDSGEYECSYEHDTSNKAVSVTFVTSLNSFSHEFITRNCE